MIFNKILLIITIIPFIIFLIQKREHDILRKINKYPKVSVIISAFNEEKVIINTIKSILNSDYPKNKLEVLVVIDKKTTDRTVDILKKIKNRNLKIISGGNSKAENLNMGIKHSLGEIISIYDSDCLVHRNAIKNAVKLLGDNDGVIGRYDFINQNKLIEKFSAISINQESEIIDKKLCRLLRTGVYYGFNAFFKKKIIEKYNFLKNIKSDAMGFSSWLSNNNYKVINSKEITCAVTVASTIKANWKQRERWVRGIIQSLKHFFVFNNSKMKITLFFQHYVQHLPLFVLLNMFFLQNLLPMLIFVNIPSLKYMLKRKDYNPLVLLYPFYLAFLGTSIISAYIKEILKIKFVWYKYERKPKNE